MTGDSAIADPTAREFLRGADPILGELIDARPDFHPRAWLEELPPLDAFGTLIFQVVAQQLSVRATRTIVSHLQQRFGGRMPLPQELLAVDPQELRASGMSNRKGATLRALAERFLDGHLPTEREMVEVAEPWRPYRSLAVSYLFAAELDNATSQRSSNQ